MKYKVFTFSTDGKAPRLAGFARDFLDAAIVTSGAYRQLVFAFVKGEGKCIIPADHVDACASYSRPIQTPQIA
jgi:hypothetical protein